ncbi:Pycsar system effector family protein [Bacteroidota bacterium]
MADLNIQEIEKFMRDLFKEKIPKNLGYHDLEHTMYVVDQSILIGRECSLTDQELDIVITAAWFHDSGFSVSALEHEKESQIIAAEYLGSKGLEKSIIDRVLLCIGATKMPQDPGDDKLAQVLCDADMAYLSKDFYLKRTALLRAEWNSISDKKMSKRTYWKETVEMFGDHSYFTDYGKEKLTPGKETNLQLIHEKLEKMQNEDKKEFEKLKSENKKMAEKLKQEKLPGRGVESMFRLTARNQINLSSIADNKANILISISSIVLTVLVSVGIGKIADYPMITIPAIVFIATCLVTIIFAILSTRPKISSGKFTKEDIHNQKVNLLFFGNFYNMDAEEYEWAVKEMMKDSNYLYSSMIRDQYSLGRVIGKKYRLLRIAYTVFMIGIILSSLIAAIIIIAAPQ